MTWRRSVLARFALLMAAIVLATTAVSVAGGAILSSLVVARANEVAASAVDAQLALVMRSVLASDDAYAVRTMGVITQIATETARGVGDAFYRVEVRSGGGALLDARGAELPAGTQCPAAPAKRGEAPGKPVHWRIGGPQPAIISCLNVAGDPALTVYAGQRIDTQTGLIWRAALVLGAFHLVVLGVFGRITAVRYSRRMEAVQQTLRRVEAGQWRPAEAAPAMTDELSELALTVESAAKATTEQIAQLESISEAISHEYRGRLTQVRGEVQFAYRMAKGGRSEEAMAALRAADAGIVKLEHEFSEFLDLMCRYANEDARREGSRALVPVRRLVSEVSAGLAARMSERSLQVTLDIPDSVQIPALGGGVLLRHTVENLLGNAAKYACEGSEVRITWEQDDAQFALRVSNADASVPTEDPSRLLQAGVRGRETVAIAGHGMGLSLAVKFCRADHLDLRLGKSAGAFDAVITGRFPSRPPATSPRA